MGEQRRTSLLAISIAIRSRWEAIVPLNDDKRIELREVAQIFRGRAFRQIGGQLVAVDRVSFTLTADPPHIVNLVGESGSGKSTIARIILGLQRPTTGHVTYRGKDIYHMSSAEFRQYRQEVQAVFQDPYGIFNPFYPVDRVLWTAIRQFKLARNPEGARALIEEALAAVGLHPADVLGRYPHQISGGQRQRMMLARVYMLRPSFIIADEPVSMLDAAVRVLFLNILLDFKQKYGMTTLFITHDLSTAYYVGGEILVLSKGKVVEQGDTDRVLVQPQHPYTQMLLDSLPNPDPDRRWRGHLDVAGTEEEEAGTTLTMRS
ncbi:MAG: ABC transporter ATP-binding protein [Chloroflexi bacterium]|nr:ABC transporter ATP-binding protein [Chloroflexota bacterium]